MNKITLLIVAVLAVVVVGGGFYWYSGTAQAPSAPAYDTQATQPTAQGDGTPVGQNLILGQNTSATLGSYLSGYNGMTLYTKSTDTTTTSSCTGACEAAWPPYTVASANDINLPAGLTGKVGTITRADGSLQVTYNGSPLYYYASDTKPGDVSGEGLGGTWRVAKP